jgi:hypothetical protein
MHASILKIQLFKILPKGGGADMCPLPPAHVSDKKRYFNINIFHFYAIFAFIISLAK